MLMDFDKEVAITVVTFPSRSKCSREIPDFLLENKWYHVIVLLKRFHLNGLKIRFHPRTQKLELCYMTLGAKIVLLFICK